MEDLYSDLENYQHENIVSELRNENQELKCKLNEYASTLASLQKEFDKLSAEYKRLELNYSSLLKTARAEIERKSQMITNLNLEKDQLVINSIQNRGKLPNRKENFVNKKQQTGRLSTNEGESEKKGVDVAVNAKPAPNLSDNSAPGEINHDRKDKYNKNTIACSVSLKNDKDDKEKEHTSKKSDVIRDKEPSKNEIKNRKENDSDVYNNVAVENKVSKIKNRRKSMPLLNRGDFKFSSDEEQDEVLKDHRFRRKAGCQEKEIRHERDVRKERDTRDNRLELDRTHHDYNHNGRNYPEKKVSEVMRMGDKHVSNYDLSRDGHRKSWYRENDRHKSRDNREKYESSQRHKRYYSPERQYNIQGEYYNKHREANDKHYWTDKIRHRTLVSPPPEKYNQYRRSREYDGQRLQQDDVNPVKHKIHDVIEEPACKRLRRESLNNQPDNHLPFFDRNVEGRATSKSRPLELSYLSLQSPDYSENNPPVHHIKEIKGTSDLKLDDPRLTSKKYIVTTNRDKVVLSTVGGRDVDMKAIDTSTWDKEKHIPEMPTPLKVRPQINDDFVKHVYMDIDNPMSNLSLESGEICLEEEMGNVGESTTHTNVINTENSNKQGLQNNIQNHDQIEVNKKATIDVTQQTVPLVLSKSYRIPKVKKSRTPNLSEDDSNNTTNHKQNKRDNTKQGHKKRTSKSKRDMEKKSQSESNSYNPLKRLCDDVNVSKKKSHKLDDISNRKNSIEKALISARDTVEGDLELSDETCDYVEVSDKTKHDKASNVQKAGESTKNALVVSISKDLITGEKEKLDCSRKEHDTFEHGIKEYCEDKKITLYKDRGREVKPKETLSKTCKDQKSKDIKSKLCDLFGDTSSLITLDDLGIAASSATKENLNEYVPIFDNTQDAVDLNVEEMEKVQTRSMKLKRDDNECVVKDDNLKLTSEIKESSSNTPTEKENQKLNNIVTSSSIQHIFENVNAAPEDNSVVKTVIISSGVQNNCHPVETVHAGEQNKQITVTQKKTDDNATNCSAVISIKALATSTPHKPQNEPSLSSVPSLSVPEISCNSNSSTALNTSNISSNAGNISKVTQSNLDIPDVRIILKRRRKAKGPS